MLTKMILRAQNDLLIDPSCSILFSDKISDIQAGTAVGVGTNLLFADDHPSELVSLNYEFIATLYESRHY